MSVQVAFIMCSSANVSSADEQLRYASNKERSGIIFRYRYSAFATVTVYRHTGTGFTTAVRAVIKARFPLPELTARLDGPSTRVVETGLNFVIVAPSECIQFALM